MDFLPAFCLILFCFNFGETKGDVTYITPPKHEIHFEPAIPTSNGPSIAQQKTTTEKIATTPASEQDSLENVSIQDLLLAGIDGNEKIQKKIISEIKDFPTYFKNYGKPIQLTTKDYSYPKKMVKYEINEGYIIFRNVSVSQTYSNYESSLFSVSVSCDSSSTATIGVGLPTEIKITSNFSITHPLIEATNEGSITIFMKNGAISKRIDYKNRTELNNGNIFFKISFKNSNIDIHFEGPQILIYKKLEDFFEEIQSSLKEYFAQQLEVKIDENQLNLQSDCSKIRFGDPNMKKINLPHFNNFINNLYVIPETKLETWKGISLSAGPIVIDGFSFNSIALSISREYDYNYGNRKKLSSQIKTGNLRGKFQWNYDLNNENGENSSSVFYFSIDNISFESDIVFRPNYGSWYSNMNVNIGKTKIKLSSSNSELNEIKFAEFVLSEYLKSAITESLKTSLSNRIDDSQRSSVNNIFNNM